MRNLSAVLAGVTLGALFFSSPVCSGQTAGQLATPAFSSIPELKNGYQLLYEQKFREARGVFVEWAARNPTEPFGQVSIAASYLFEEFYLQRVLTSDYFLDDKRFLGASQARRIRIASGHLRTRTQRRVRWLPYS